ncbi:MAG: alpha/beta fold hydrolase [Acidobacteriota bacterium]
MRKRAATWLLGGGAAIAALDLARRLYRQSQIFEPLREPLRTWDPADYGIPPGAVEEFWIDTPDRERLHAWYARAPQPTASALFCHGNTGNLTKSADVIPHLLEAGLSVLFFDYRGFGKSSGRANYRGVLADGVTAARFHDALRPQALPSVLYGFSLGGAIAAQVLRRHSFDALILQSTFTSLMGLTRTMYPNLPMHLIAGRLFDTLRVIRDLTVPLLVMHGTADETVPFPMSGELYEACPTRKRIHIVEGALHKDMYDRDGAAMVKTLREFIAELA